MIAALVGCVWGAHQLALARAPSVSWLHVITAAHYLPFAAALFGRLRNHWRLPLTLVGLQLLCVVAIPLSSQLAFGTLLAFAAGIFSAQILKQF